MKKSHLVVAGVLIVVLVLGGWLWLSDRDHAADPEPQTGESGSGEDSKSGTREKDRKEQENPAKDEPVEKHTLIGSVHDVAGEPIASAKVAVIGPDGDLITQATTGDDGQFTTERLPLEVYALEVTAEGYANGRDGRAVPGGPPRQVVLEPGFDARFAVTNNGKGKRVMCHVGGAGLFPMRTVESDENGVCVVSGLPVGRWTALATRDYAGSGPVSFDVRENEPPGTTRLKLQDTPPLIVTVTDAEFADDDVLAGEGAIEEALVTIAQEPLHVWSFNDVTDPEGFVTFHGLTPGRWYVTVRASGYLPWGPEPVDLPLDEPLQVIPERGARISGTVQTPAGTAISGAELLATVETEEGGWWFVNRDDIGVLNHLVRPDGTTIGRGTSRYRSQWDGSFSIAGLPGGKVQLTATREGWLTSEPALIDLPKQGHVTDVVLELQQGSPLQGRVVSPAGGGIEGARVRWRRPGSGAWGWVDPVQANDRGVFLLPAVPDQIQLEASADGWRTTVTQVSLDDIGDEDLLIELMPPGGGLRGRVLGPDGPVNNTEVYGVGVGGPLDCRYETGPDGLFTLESCGEGTVLLRADADDFGPVWRAATVGSELEIELPRPSLLAGKVVDESARLLPEARLTLSASVSVSGWPDPVQWQHAKTVYDGNIDLGGLPTLDTTVTVQAEGFLPEVRKVELVPGEAVDLGQVVLLRQAVVSGWVLDDVGGPVQNARVELTGQDTQVMDTDENGAFRGAVKGGEATLQARHWLYGVGTARTRVEKGATSEVEIRLTEPVGSDAWRDLMAADGVVIDREERGWIVLEVQEPEPWGNAGLARGDHIEHLNVQNGEVVRVTAVRSGGRRELR